MQKIVCDECCEEIEKTTDDIPNVNNIDVESQKYGSIQPNCLNDKKRIIFEQHFSDGIHIEYHHPIQSLEQGDICPRCLLIYIAQAVSQVVGYLDTATAIMPEIRQFDAAAKRFIVEMTAEDDANETAS